MITGLLADALRDAGLDPSALSLRGAAIDSPRGPLLGKEAAGAAGAQVRGEAASLAALALTAPPGLVPRAWSRTRDGATALVCEHARGGGARRMRELGARLAAMHTVPEDTGPPGADHAYTGRFGFGVPTHCGATPQDNTWDESWARFFADRRVGDLVARLGDADVAREWARLRHKAVPLLLDEFDPPARPVPLHGDLWAGNVCHTRGGAVIFDPAGYYGHGEADLGIARMFGGFGQDFFDAYHAVHPRSQPHYEQRQRLYELYHHLNHALMFGGAYRQGALGIMRELAAWADGVA